MQPESNESFQKLSQSSSNPDTPPNSQHGPNDPDPQPNRQLAAAPGRADPRRPSSRSPLSDTSSDGSSEASERPSRRLSRSRSQGGSPVDRISDHEKALARSAKKKRSGPVFTVVQRSRAPGSNHVALADFPNEVLTHILSHLPPSSLLDVSLVSRRFHELVTTPHAWRIAFSRYFPGAEAISTLETNSNVSEDSDATRTERRLFTRLTTLASWRSEYILRTRLLRALARGRPAEFDGQTSPKSSRSSTGSIGSAQITYSSGLTSTIDHLHANFGTGPNKKVPRLIHGASDLGMASTSDPRLGKVGSWGFSHMTDFRHFADTYTGYAEYGLGDGEIVGIPNMMDVSQSYGMVYGEGLPSGILWYKHLEEKRGCSLQSISGLRVPDAGVPNLATADPVCVWIAKSSNIPELSEGLIGLFSGSSNGVVTAYSAGTTGLRDRRFERGEITARWVLSPGVPIVAIVVDDAFSSKRMAANRIWAVALNALGETYYLTELPKEADVEGKPVNAQNSDTSQRLGEKRAWKTGRSVHWTLVEPTRRVARVDPYETSDVDGSYSPRSSWNGMHLGREQLIAETKEIESLLDKKPKHFQKVCLGWDMRRRLEVDFAASDEHGAGENILVVGCGLDEGQTAEIRRYTRCKIEEPMFEPLKLKGHQVKSSTEDLTHDGTLFGSPPSAVSEPTWSFGAENLKRRSPSIPSSTGNEETLIEEWRVSNFSFGDLRAPQITTTVIDKSKYATLTFLEDPLLSTTLSSVASSPASSPLPKMPAPTSTTDIPGQRARLIAVGTKTGSILLWNLRASTAPNTVLPNTITPLRIIHTTSPQISSLALTALYLVHGGNDGLVQAWDPLASTTSPIRTLNSRFSSRARRRLIQAEESPHGVGINLFAAAAIALDPDPTSLRGVVSLGSHLRYWSYSSLAADQYKGNKRRPRRSERGNQAGGDTRFSGTGRGAVKEYIANEKLELEMERRDRAREQDRLAGRFGLDLLGPGASEEEMMQYAIMVSEEAARGDELRRKSEGGGDDGGGLKVPRGEDRAVGGERTVDNMDGDDDVAEAIRLSLLDGLHGGLATKGEPSFQVRYGKVKGGSLMGLASASASAPSSVAAAAARVTGGGGGVGVDEDLEFALRLSLAEEESRGGEGRGKGKGREA